jgi:hypothetical protein
LNHKSARALLSTIKVLAAGKCAKVSDKPNPPIQTSSAIPYDSSHSPQSAAQLLSEVTGSVVVFCYSEDMSSGSGPPRKLRPTWKALVEIGFIIFLFYSNLLMGEFTRANGHGKSLTFAIEDIFSLANLAIAVVSGLLGYVVFEYLRKHL